MFKLEAAQRLMAAHTLHISVKVNSNMHWTLSTDGKFVKLDDGDEAVSNVMFNSNVSGREDKEKELTSAVQRAFVAHKGDANAVIEALVQVTKLPRSCFKSL